MSRPIPLVQSEAVTPASAPPLFRRIAIVGLGLIGGSIALACRKRWPQAFVIAVDEKPVLEKAVVLHAVDVAADQLYIASEAELVILAAPVQQIIARLGELPKHVDGQAIVTDTGSTKRAIVEAARSLPTRLTFIGGHPLGGATRAGIEHARADLFEKRPWLFTPESEAAPEPVQKLIAFASALGARPEVISPSEHDRLLAYLSHLPQLAASALMHVIGQAAGDQGLRLAGRGLIDTTRLAASPVGIWIDVCATNADAIEAGLDEFILTLERLRRGLGSVEALHAIFASANRWRDSLQKAGPEEARGAAS